MKILKREDFLKIKGKVLYSDSCGYYFEDLKIKLKTIKDGKEQIDWYYNPLIDCWPKDIRDSDEFFSFFDNHIKSGESFELDLDSIERDGFFGEYELFLVYEKEDIEKLISKLQNIIKGYK